MSIDVRTYLDLERALTLRLQKTWAALAPDLFHPIEAAIKRKDWAAAYDAAREIDASPVVEGNRQYIKYLLLATANFGAAMANPKEHTFVSAGNFSGFLDTIVQNMVDMAERTLNTELYAHCLAMIVEAQQPAQKSNPYHDDDGKFTTADGAVQPGHKKLPTVEAMRQAMIRVGEGEFTRLVEEHMKTFPNGMPTDYAHEVERVARRVLATQVTKDYVDGDPTNLLAPADRNVKDFVSFAGTGMQGVKLVSTLHSSRMAVWGFTAEADTLGFEYYTLTPVLDNRTSKFCRMLGERKLVFKIQQAKDLINRALAAQTGDEIASIQPWPRQDKASMESYWDMDADELAANGWATPPFHPFCRTLLTRADNQPNLGEQPDDQAQQDEQQSDEQDQQDMRPEGQEALDGTLDDIVWPQQPPEQPQPEQQAAPEQQTIQSFGKATVDDFAELGLDVNQQEVDYWNAYVGKSPVEILAGLTGFKALDVLDGAEEGGTRPIVFTAAGDIKFQYEGNIGESEDMGVANVNMVYDPLDGTLYQNYMDVTSDNPEFVAEYVKQYYQGLVDTGQIMDADRIVINGVGDSGVYTYLTMGMAPTPGDWSNLRGAILDDLQDGHSLGDLASKLSEADLATVTDLLNSSDAGAAEALAALPIDVEGDPIGKLLFKDRAAQMVLDLNDTTAVSTFLGDEA